MFDGDTCLVQKIVFDGENMLSWNIEFDGENCASNLNLFDGDICVKFFEFDGEQCVAHADSTGLQLNLKVLVLGKNNKAICILLNFI